MAWNRGNNADGQIWDALEVELEGETVRLAGRLKERKET